MDVKLESLIEKIKKDGIEEANKKSEEIIGNARQQALNIKGDAEKQAKDIVDAAKKEALRLKESGESMLRQAARDLVLVLREKITELFDSVLKRSISDEMTSEFVGELVARVVDKWPHQKKADLEVLVNKEDKDKVEAIVLSRIKNQAKDKIEINVSDRVEKGFRIGVKGENLYYDFTDESILEALKEFLSPGVSGVLNGNNG